MTTKPPTQAKPYLIRALYEWCVDNGHTPYLAVAVNKETHVPMEYVKNGEIVLNIGAQAVHKLAMGNDYIEFAARFNGVSRDVLIPMDAIVGIYARESGQGMAFELTAEGAEGATAAAPPAGDGKAAVRKAEKQGEKQGEKAGDKKSSDDDQPPRPPGGGRPKLHVVK